MRHLLGVRELSRIKLRLHLWKNVMRVKINLFLITKVIFRLLKVKKITKAQICLAMCHINIQSCPKANFISMIELSNFNNYLKANTIPLYSYIPSHFWPYLLLNWQTVYGIFEVWHLLAVVR